MKKQNDWETGNGCDWPEIAFGIIFLTTWILIWGLYFTEL